MCVIFENPIPKTNLSDGTWRWESQEGTNHEGDVLSKRLVAL